MLHNHGAFVWHSTTAAVVGGWTSVIHFVSWTEAVVVVVVVYKVNYRVTAQAAGAGPGMAICCPAARRTETLNSSGVQQYYVPFHHHPVNLDGVCVCVRVSLSAAK